MRLPCARATVREIVGLCAKAAQVIVLSHSKQLLCDLWNAADQNQTSPLQLVRGPSGSDILPWNVTADCITDHDHRDRLFRNYVANGGTNQRDVAVSLRPHLEYFFRAACPRHFPPGTLLGHFANIARQRLGGPDEVLSKSDLDELEDLIDYGNLFHHDSNPTGFLRGLHQDIGKVREASHSRDTNDQDGVSNRTTARRKTRRKVESLFADHFGKILHVPCSVAIHRDGDRLRLQAYI